MYTHIYVGILKVWFAVRDHLRVYSDIAVHVGGVTVIRNNSLVGSLEPTLVQAWRLSEGKISETNREKCQVF